MPTWKLELEYDGTRYRGWQIEHNAKSIQAEMQEAARQLFASRAEIFGAEPTDAGVHAVAQIAHLKVPDLTANITPRQIQEGFNDVLPYDINIRRVSNAPDDFHARHDAVGRCYLYQISNRRTAMAKNFVWWVKEDLDAAAMNRAAAMLIGEHDFTSFSEPNDDGRKRSSLVTVTRSGVFTDGDLICFRIGASHFLWKMVRRIVGMLVEVGRGNATYDAFGRLLRFESDIPAKFTAPPSGLFLERVLYQGDTAPDAARSLVPVR